MKTLVSKLLLLITFGLTVTVCLGQFDLPSSNRSDLKGKVRLATQSREYWITNGRAHPPSSTVISQTEYDRDGRIIRESMFGNVEQRSTYTYSAGRENIEIKYFDINGHEVPAGKQPFVPRADIPITDDLCAAYSGRTEIDKKAGIKRIIETCNSGALRATIVIEENSDSSYVRHLREDGKGRSFESITVWAQKDAPKEQRYLVNNLKSPKYSWNISYVNAKSDGYENLIEVIASAVHSSRPSQVWYQFVEKWEFVYFD